MKETKQTHVDGIVDDVVLKRFMNYMERLESDPEAPECLLFHDNNLPFDPEAYAVFVLHVPDADRQSDLIQEFNNRFAGSYPSWDVLCREFQDEELLSDQISSLDLEELRELSILEASRRMQDEIRWRLEAKFWIIPTSTGTIHMFMR